MHHLVPNEQFIVKLKKSNKRLYIFRQLFKCGLAKSEIVNVYCTLIMPIIEYASVVCSNLPTYLSKLIENMQKQALKIIWPDVTYTEALHSARLISLSERRSDACVKFVMGISEGNPLFPLSITAWLSQPHSMHCDQRKQTTPGLCGRIGLPIL